MVRDSDARCSRGHCPSHNTFLKVQTQGITAKKPGAKESKPKVAKQADGKASALPHSDESVKPTRQEKKKEYRKKKQNRKNSSPATGDNAIKDKKGNGKCYNCQKKGHIARNCPEPPKNLCWSWQPPCRWLMVVRRSSGCLASTTRFNSRKSR